jgi:site-specific DNA-cytosine methylase
MVIVMTWNFHPKPQTKPITIREAFRGLNESEPCPIVMPEYIRKVAREITPGDFNSDKVKPILAKHNNGKTGGFMSLKRLSWHKESCTLIKSSHWGNIGIIHPNGERFINEAELKRVGSFPDDFIFPDSLGFKNVIERIGNSVPPNLMRAIAENIKNSPFLRDTDRLTAIDTFSGCGGSSLGLKLAGYDERLAVEWDDNASATYRVNFPDTPLYHGDIAKLSLEKAIKLSGLRLGELDLLTGSPPCQGFSVAGKRNLYDDRNQLFKEYCRFLQGFKPKAFVMENVPGMIRGHMKQVALNIYKELRSCEYEVRGQVLNAKYYGVPQSRERVILVGVRSDLVQRH